MVEASTYIKKGFSLYSDHGGSFQLFKKRIFFVFWTVSKLPIISKKDFICILIMVEASNYIKKGFPLYFYHCGKFHLYQKKISFVFWSWRKLPSISKKDLIFILIMVEASNYIKKGYSLYFVHGGNFSLYQKMDFLCILIMVEASNYIKKGFSLYFDHSGSFQLYQKKFYLVFWS